MREGLSTTDRPGLLARYREAHSQPRQETVRWSRTAANPPETCLRGRRQKPPTGPESGRSALRVVPAAKHQDDRTLGLLAMAVISLKLPEALDAQLTAQAQRRRLSKSELVRRALTAFLQSSEPGVDGYRPQFAADLLADLVGCCEDGPVDLSSNPADLSDFGIH